MEDISAREDDATRIQAGARIASMALALVLEVIEVPGDANYFPYAARFAFPTHEAMRAEICSFWWGMSDKFDSTGISLDDVRMAWRDYGPIPLESVVLEPPRLSLYVSWDQRLDEMEHPSAYTDQLFAQ